MRMSTDDSGESSDRRNKVQLFYVVNQVQEFSRELYRFCLVQMPKALMSVNVSANGGDGRDPAKTFENLRIADIPGM